jgi:hypothetical protein
MMELRGKCIAYGSYKKSLKIKTEQKLIEEIKILEDMLQIDNTLLDKWETKQKELEALRTEKLNGHLHCIVKVISLSFMSEILSLL